MNKAFLILLFVVNSALSFAQNTISVSNQQCTLNTEHVIDSVSFRGIVLSFDIKDFWGPFVTHEYDGYSKQYWYNSPNRGEGNHVSSLYAYSGAAIRDESFDSYGVTATVTTMTKDGRKTIEGEVDGLFFRADYYCSNQLMLAYYYVSKDNLSYFDFLLDTVIKTPQ